jgi:UDP-N-acetylglucosamine 2-epimerase (non-hydrolysing)/GDP/UDP-N,N'-diacetylbacillosamine 2-epimerase (hydrolysing)
MIKICVITGSRAEYGLLSRLMKLIEVDRDLCLQIIATNMHLSPEFGLTYKEIENDGFIINKKVNMLLSSDDSNSTTKSVGLATIGFADAFEELKPDLVLVLGDRFEILSAVTATIFYKIPVAHIHGGEITEGAYDNAIRHAITKISHLHFTSTENYRTRVIQMGEMPNLVFNVGAIGIDNIKHCQLMTKDDLESNFNFKFGENCALVTFHPVTLENETAENQIINLLDALDKISNLNLIFTLPNSDTGGKIIIKLINEFVLKNKTRAIVIASLGKIKYYSTLQFVKLVIGNSSSGILEVPTFGITTLNIGTRQKGRIKADTVIDCEPTSKDIYNKTCEILVNKIIVAKNKSINPYEKSETASTILKIIKETKLDVLINKTFYNLNEK